MPEYQTVDEQIKESIARIHAGDVCPNQGTAFLVKNNENQRYVLTAFHVIVEEDHYRDLINKDIQLKNSDEIKFLSPIELKFKSVKCNAEVVPNCWNILEDWVLLKIKETDDTVLQYFKTIKPLSIRELTELDKNKEWRAFGFPEFLGNSTSKKENDLILIGKIKSVEPKFELLCTEFSGQKKISASGYSGSPCIVDDQVVGILIKELVISDEHSEETNLATLYARWINSIIDNEDFKKQINLVDPQQIKNPKDEYTDLNLIIQLAKLYPDVEQARALWERAGGEGMDVPYNNQPRDLWQVLWKKSENGASVTPEQLLKTVLCEYPKNEVFNNMLKNKKLNKV